MTHEPTDQWRKSTYDTLEAIRKEMQDGAIEIAQRQRGGMSDDDLRATRTASIERIKRLGVLQGKLENTWC